MALRDDPAVDMENPRRFSKGAHVNSVVEAARRVQTLICLSKKWKWGSDRVQFRAFVFVRYRGLREKHLAMEFFMRYAMVWLKIRKCINLVDK